MAFSQKSRVIKTYEELDGTVSKDSIIIQGSNSKELKYSPNLCSKCNNERTQPYDIAYEKFSKYIKNNEHELRRVLAINTNIIFGKSYAKKQQQNLFRYFMKSFGCKLHDNNITVPQEIKDGLMGKSFGSTFIELAYEFLVILSHTYTTSL